MNYKKIFKRETKVIAYVVIALTLVVIGTSYALFLQVENNQDNQIVTAGSLTIAYNNANKIEANEEGEIECLIPQSDSDAEESGCLFTMSITNNGTLPMKYNLLIYDDKTAASTEDWMEHSNIKYSLNRKITSKEGQNSVPVVNVDNLSELDKKDEVTLETNHIEVGETIEYSFRIWIDENAPGEIIGQYVSLKLDVVGDVYEAETATTNLIQTNNLTKINVKDTIEYRYTGESLNNYVYFNCSDDSVSSCEVWRILGIYDNQIKLIQDTSNLVMVFDDSEEDFATSSIRTYLNNDFYNSLNKSAKSMIAPFGFKTGGISSLEESAMDMYNEENANENYTYAKVGLMNISDYALVSSSNDNNWLNTSQNEWFINHDENGQVYSLEANGSIVLSNVSEEKLVRPVVYLYSTVTIADGNGSRENPYVLSK